MKKPQIKTMKADSVKFQLITNTEGGPRNAYIRLEDFEGNYRGSISETAKIRKLKSWCEFMLSGETHER